jgi:hypothetical protein
MSSPIHLDDNNTGLIYAPPSRRERIPSVTRSPFQSRVAAAEMGAKKSRPKFSGDRAMLELHQQLALDPALIAEPPSEDAAVIRPLLARLCSVSALAALVAWGLVSYSSEKSMVQDGPRGTSTAAIASNHVNVIDVQSLRLRPSIARTADTLAATGKPQADAGADTPPIESKTLVASAETASAPPTTAPRATDRRELRLDSEDISVLIKRGKDLLADGDVAASRLLLRRAAEAGSAEGAFILGTTFDPVSLERLGAIGAAPDLARARQWYQRAAELGSTVASQHLAGLGDAR